MFRCFSFDEEGGAERSFFLATCSETPASKKASLRIPEEWLTVNRDKKGMSDNFRRRRGEDWRERGFGVECPMS
jgi:hypothetical protein